MDTGVALPDDEYLRQIGVVAYTASSLEWTLLGDLGRLADELPEGLHLEDLEPSTTAGIAKKVKKAAEGMESGPVKDYLVAAHEALSIVAEIRNDVLHARPATHPQQGQRLNRAEVSKGVTTGVRTWIDDARLENASSRLRAEVDKVNAARPPLE